MERSYEISEAFISERVNQLSQLPREYYKRFVFPDNTVQVYTSASDKKVYGIIHTLDPNAFFYFESLYDENLDKHKPEFLVELKNDTDLKDVWKERWGVELTNLS